MSQVPQTPSVLAGGVIYTIGVEPLDGVFPVTVVVGQLSTLQDNVSVSLKVPALVIDNENISCDVHSDPPNSGSGLAQSLTLDCCPPPQVEEQSFQSRQDSHDPSTTMF